MVTKGQWEVKGLGIFKKDSAEDELGIICLCQIDNSPEEAIANAYLIVSAVNACKEINPDNPQAAAESIQYAFETIKEVLRRDECGSIRLPTQASDILKIALAKADRR